MAELTQNRYGKSLVKVLRVFRNGDHHDIRDLNVQVLLQGDHLEESYFTGDNSFIVPTDTVKNTVFYLAKTNPPKDIESFGVTIGRHFINEYPHIHAVDIDIVEKPWSRINVDGKPHQHSFIPDAEERTASIKVTRKALDRPQVVSGLRNLLVLKTTNSEFVGFSKCKYTTLKEAKDRIFKTTVRANWSYGRLGSHSTVDYNAIYDQVKKNIFKVFATTYSKAVQQTIWDMGREILANVDEIQEVFFALPNQHNWTWDGTPFGVTNANEVFIPQADPSGLIEGTISRKHLARL